MDSGFRERPRNDVGEEAVIPAKAGIHVSSDSTGFQMCEKWIPGSASGPGMTGGQALIDCCKQSGKETDLIESS